MQWKDAALALHRCLTPDSHRLFEKRLGQGPRSKYYDTASKFAFIAEYQIYPVFDIERAGQSLRQGVEFREALSSARREGRIPWFSLEVTTECRAAALAEPPQPTVVRTRRFSPVGVFEPTGKFA